jgi:Fe2+ or Zn2+ uptake regulation protein
MRFRYERRNGAGRMPLSSSKVQPRNQSPESVLNAMRGHGLRVSTARRMIVHTLCDAERPLSAEEIAVGLSGGGTRLDVGSVYRNLETFERLAFVRRLQLGNSPARYLLTAGSEREFLACERCGHLVETEPGELDGIRSEIGRRFGYEVRFTRFPVVGLCPQCVAKGLRQARKPLS